MALSKLNNDSFADTAIHGRRNLVINGAVNINQRNADNTSSDTFGPDRYRLQFSGGGTTMSHEDMTSSDTPYSNGFRNFVRIKNTTTASGAGDYRQIVYRLEAQDIANSGWDYTSTSAYMTVSFWVRSSVAGKFYFTLETGAGGSDKYYGFSETLVADTWKKVEHSVPGNSTLTFANSNARGLGFIVRGWLGTNYTDSGFTEDTWGSFSLSSLTGDDLANWAGTTNSTLDIVGLQMEVGDKATPFEHRSFADELARCERYYQKSYAYGTALGTATLAGIRTPGGAAGGETTGYIEGEIRMHLPMRATPSIVIYDQAGTANKCTRLRTGIGRGDGQHVAASNANDKSFQIYSTGTATGSNIQAHFTVDAEL